MTKKVKISPTGSVGMESSTDHHLAVVAPTVLGRVGTPPPLVEDAAVAEDNGAAASSLTMIAPKAQTLVNVKPPTDDVEPPRFATAPPCVAFAPTVSTPLPVAAVAAPPVAAHGNGALKPHRCTAFDPPASFEASSYGSNVPTPRHFDTDGPAAHGSDAAPTKSYRNAFDPPATLAAAYYGSNAPTPRHCTKDRAVARDSDTSEPPARLAAWCYDSNAPTPRHRTKDSAAIHGSDSPPTKWHRTADRAMPNAAQVGATGAVIVQPPTDAGATGTNSMEE
jgi:hypothetical protein